MRFDDQLLQQIRNSLSIIDLVGGYVQLRKSGTNHAGLCPFHHEKTPSFLVSENKQIFKCFGCGVGGDVFKFVMLIENIGFYESVEFLADRTGVTLPQRGESENAEAKQRKRHHKIMEAASDFFSRCLQNSPAARESRLYLQKRQIETSTQEQFGLGYAPGGGQLGRHLNDLGFKEKELLACGLIKEGQGGQHYERFRQRIIFPIRDLSGRAIAFGGRILGDGVPKYLNSPETILYSKGSNLYALDTTRMEIRRESCAILVEGYFDCVVPFQFGFRNVVASLGTSLTAGQVKLLGHYTRKVIVSYDPDSAGMSATMRSIDLFLDQGFDLNILELTTGQDPDSFLRNEGAEAYREKLDSATPYIDFILSYLTGQQADPSSPQGKQEIVRQILPHLIRLPNQIERAEYVARVASRLRLDENLILSEMRRTRPRARERVLTSPQPSSTEPLTPAEKTVIWASLEKDYSQLVFQSVEPDWFKGMQAQKVFEAIFKLRAEEDEISVAKLRPLLDEAEMAQVEKLAFGSSYEPLSQEIVSSSIQALKRKHFEYLSREIQERIRDEEQSGADSATLEELLLRKEEIRKKLQVNSV